MFVAAKSGNPEEPGIFRGMRLSDAVDQYPVLSQLA